MKTLALLLLLAMASAGSAANVPWEELPARILDKQVVLRDVDGVSTRGTVRGINDREITLIRGNGDPQTISRERVNRLQLWSRGNGAMKGLLWGAAVGAVVYGFVAYRIRADSSNGTTAGVFLGGTGMFAGAGSGIGAAFGGVSTIYQAPKDGAEKLQSQRLLRSWEIQTVREAGVLRRESNATAKNQAMAQWIWSPAAPESERVPRVLTPEYLAKNAELR